MRGEGVERVGMSTVTPVLGDITQQKVDVIVNAANRELCGGGGVDGAIWRAAGHDQMMRACNTLGGCEVGEAKFTPGFDLPAKWVIHTVGPVWVGGPKLRGEHEWRWSLVQELKLCYVNSIRLAEELEAKSIAFPAISTGVFRFPIVLAAATAVSTVVNMTTTLEEIRLVAYDHATYDLYRALLHE